MLNRRGIIGGILGSIAGLFITKNDSAKANQILEPRKIYKVEELHRIRVWKLGSLEHRIIPTQDTINKFADMLVKWDGKSDLDLIWGPDIQVECFYVTANDIDFLRKSQSFEEFKRESERTE
jgi:hypothetical protein